jgi:hypothetical protein
VVLLEGGYKQGEREEEKPPSLCELIEASANILVKAEEQVVVLSVLPAARGPPPPFIDQGEVVYSCAAWL